MTQTHCPVCASLLYEGEWCRGHDLGEDKWHQTNKVMNDLLMRGKEPIRINEEGMCQVEG